MSQPSWKLTQSKLSFPKAAAKARSPPKPPRELKPPHPPPSAEEEEEEVEAEEDEPEYEVSRIISHHDNENGRYYKVAWVGFPEEESTYLTEAELGGARELLEKYKKMVRKMEKGVRE